MKATYLLLILGLISSCGFAQESYSSNFSYNLFSCENCSNKFFIASNSGLRNTPVGIKIGFICKTGAYLGTRFGKGELNKSDGSTVKTNSFSITTGIIKPVFIQNNFSLHVFAGVGYGQWWPHRSESWTKDGYELEGGFMISYKKLMLNLSTNVLNGYKMYATWDFTAGLGYRF